MSADNGNDVVRISRKGKKKFAFGEEGEPFEVDVVEVFQHWCDIDESMREDNEEHSIKDMPTYHQAAVGFVKAVSMAGHTKQVGSYNLTVAEALDFLARLREVYDDLTDFFRPKSSKERGLPGTSEEGSTLTSAKTEMRFSAEDF